MSSFAPAGEPVQQKFGNWTVTIQSGIRGSSPRDSVASSLRLISQEQPAPADAVEAFPPVAPAAQPTTPPPAPQSPEQLREVQVAETTPAGTPSQLSLVRMYSQVYNSIPFSRAEYNANPSYRHDATMEFLFGQLRPMTIQRSTTIVKQRSGGMPMGGLGYPGYSPYGFNSYYYPFYNQGGYWLYNLW